MFVCLFEALGLFNLILSCRSQFLLQVKEAKGAKSLMKAINPTTEYLFGGKAKEVGQDVKASEELNPLAKNEPNFSRKRKGFQGNNHGAGGSFSKHFKPFRGDRGGRGGPSGRGGKRSDRLSKFSDN